NCVPNTEDANTNRYIDRFLLWGGDTCSPLAGGGVDPSCPADKVLSSPQYVWPGGCNLVRGAATTPINSTEGCPAFANGQNVSLTPADDVNDTHLIQGGDIKMGGFTLGVGFK